MDKTEYDKWLKDNHPWSIRELEGTERKEAMRHLFMDATDLVKTNAFHDGRPTIFWLIRVDEYVTVNKNTKLITHYYKAVR